MPSQAINSHFDIFIITILLIFPSTHSKYSDHQNFPLGTLSEERTRSFALIFSFIQCFPNISHSNNDLDVPSQKLLQIHQTFDPERHLDEYSNLTDVKNLISFVKELEESGTPNDLPFTNSAPHIAALNIVLKVLYHNSENWPLFYKTSVWLLIRVNAAMLFWALMIVASEKYAETVTVPNAAEIIPQLFLPKNYVLSAAGLHVRSTPEHPLHYWMSDPGLHNFHIHWHMDHPFWWREDDYGVTRHRQGEIFLYLHHQLVCRYNAELLSIGKGEVEPLGLFPDDVIPEGYTPDIVNLDHKEFFVREDGTRIGDFDDGSTLAMLREFDQRLLEGIEEGFFLGPSGNHVDFRGENGTDILGKTVEPVTVHSANIQFYGIFHNLMHRCLGGVLRPQDFPVPGITAHSETALRDPVFYQIHKRVDKLFLKYKSTMKPYTQDDLDFPGISIIAVEVLTKPHFNTDLRWRPYHEASWPFISERLQPSTLTTYFRTETFDISNAARPCRTINDEPVPVHVKILDYVPFSYAIAIKSTRPTVAYGMVRIFIWPERTQDGKTVEGDAAHEKAIELDRFRVRINPGRVMVINRSSLDSSLTKREPAPGIKTLYRVNHDSYMLTKSEIRRACAFPNNLLIPRGNEEGVPFKVTVYLSDETDDGETEENQFPYYPLCGALHGKPYPDKRPMGFPFDRPWSVSNITSNSDYSPVDGYSSPLLKNLKQVTVIIKHVD